MKRVAGKTAIVTGGGIGIGRAISKMLASEGANVVLTQRHEEKALETVADIENLGGQAMYVQQDVVKEEDWSTVLRETESRFGTPDILVNNAGVYLIKDIVECTVDDWQRVMDINGLGVMLGMKHVAPRMEEKGVGSIVNISSAAGIIGFPGHAIYGATKGAVRIMTKDAAMEYAKRGVRINSVHPAYIDTQMADYGAEKNDVSKKELGGMHPIGHIGKPEDVAYGVLYLASDESAFVTGAELVIDGGLTAQ